MIDLLRSHVGDGKSPVTLTEEEAAALAIMLDFESEIVEQAKYKRAKKLIWERYRSAIIGLATLIAAITALWDASMLGRFFAWLSKNFS